MPAGCRPANRRLGKALGEDVVELEQALSGILQHARSFAVTCRSLAAAQHGRGILHEAVVDERAHGGMGGLHCDVRAAGQLGERDAGLGVDVTEETELARC
jgi:predicted hotdog family 3-hydroxylacyl-ACP dehydratase